MKAKSFLIPVLLIVLIAFNVNAQEGSKKCETHEHHKKCLNIPDLTDSQKEKIETIHVAHLKEALQLKNQLKEKKAHHKTLMTQEKADMNAINANIDEMGVLRTDLMKKEAKTKQDIRALLDEKQKLFFDTHGHKEGHHKGGMKHKGEVMHGHKDCKNK